jgi:hypothetical protein
LNPKPFVKLKVPRFLIRPDLPPDLVKFYEQNEGVGLESSPLRVVRICRLDEVTRIGWRDLRVLGEEECPGWEGFAGLRIGISSFFDEIVYVLHSPCCSLGAILTLGVDVSGPGGSGSAPLEPSLVLAATFQEWLRNLERMNWVEYGLVPGSIADLPESQHSDVRRYYHKLNPGSKWGGI